MKDFSFPDKGNDFALRNRGIVTPGCLILILLIALLAYVGFKVGEAYWTYYQVREKVRESLVWSVPTPPKDEASIAQKVISNVSDAGVQLKPKNIRITQTKDALTIRVTWTQEIEFVSFIYPLNFEVKLTEAKRWERGGLIIK